MILAVFGASGGVGLEVVRQALAAGDSVRALARRPDMLNLNHENLIIEQGDARDIAAVERVTTGSNAVISALGLRRSEAIDTCSVATLNIIAAMQRCGVKRLACVTGCMVGHPPHLMRSLFYTLFRTLEFGALGRMMRDRREQERLIMGSGLDWTIIRPPRLKDGPHTGRYAVASDLVIRLNAYVRRADVADALLRAVRQGQFTRQAVALDASQA